MKTPALPTRISSLFAFLWLLLLIALGLLTLFGFLFTSQSHAATIVFGRTNTKDSFPFGVDTKGGPLYLGRYQQVYNRAVFPGPRLITEIAFADSGSLVAGRVTYQLSLALGVTGVPPSQLGAAFLSGATPVFSGSVEAAITPVVGDFDFSIPLTTPFLYDPSQGYLLLEVVMSGSTGTTNGGVGYVYSVSGDTSDFGRIYTSKGAVTAGAFSGLVTQFTVTPAPEPAAAALLCAGAALGVSRRGRRAE